ncbi:MAG: hypothetical protein EBS69_08175, partial [Verrucomicrobia bacterium]|nr:hypothetical protein [Verrucomicrobiota bacterium]NBT24526.1 hypothetical protein [bacterium]
MKIFTGRLSLFPFSLRALFLLHLGLVFPLAAHAADPFFTPPEAPFVTSPKEVIERVTIPSGKVEAAQSLIDSARKEKPDAVL